VEVNFLLPISLFTMIALSILIYKRVAEKTKELLGDKKIGLREAISIVIFISVLVIIIGLIPGYAIQILFIAAFSYILFIFTYLLSKRAIASAIPPAIYVTVFLLLNYLITTNALIIILVTNLFSALFAIIAITLLGPLFSWRVLMLFAALLTAMDIIHVFITGYMVEAAHRVIGLGLPLMLLLPRPPSLTELTALGLGDVFLSGLLSAHTTSKYSLKAGLLTAASISMIFLAFDIIVYKFTWQVKTFPATLLVLLGWLLGISPYILKSEGNITKLRH